MKNKKEWNHEKRTFSIIKQITHSWEGGRSDCYPKIYWMFFSSGFILFYDFDALNFICCCAKLWYRWCVINKITYIFCICQYFSAILVYVLYRWVFLNEKWPILLAMPCDRLNYHPLPCDRLNWHTLLNQWEDRKFTWNILTYNIQRLKNQSILWGVVSLRYSDTIHVKKIINV